MANIPMLVHSRGIEPQKESYEKMGNSYHEAERLSQLFCTQFLRTEENAGVVLLEGNHLDIWNDCAAALDLAWAVTGDLK